MAEQERDEQRRGGGTQGDTAGDPGRTPGKAEGDESTVDEDLKRQGDSSS
jgi:hypothetical protein